MCVYISPQKKNKKKQKNLIYVWDKGQGDTKQSNLLELKVDDLDDWEGPLDTGGGKKTNIE